jgi:hypothetical protein
MNQMLTQDLLRLHDPSVHPQYRQYVRQLENVLSALEANGEPLGIDGMKILNGAKSQAAVANLLSEAGYEIILPDPDTDVQDPINRGNEMSEAVFWDYMGSTDFVAVNREPPMKIFLIDTQSAKMADPKVRQLFAEDIQNQSPEKIAKIRNAIKQSVGSVMNLHPQDIAFARMVSLTISVPSNQSLYTPEYAFNNQFVKEKILAGVRQFQT